MHNEGLPKLSSLKMRDQIENTLMIRRGKLGDMQAIEFNANNNRYLGNKTNIANVPNK